MMRLGDRSPRTELWAGLQSLGCKALGGVWVVTESLRRQSVFSVNTMRLVTKPQPHPPALLVLVLAANELDSVSLDKHN